MNRFALLAITTLACTTAACSHYAPYTDQPAAQQTTTTSSVENKCSTTREGRELTKEECAAQAHEMMAPLPGAQTVTTGKTCKTVNGVQSCTAY